MYIIGQKYLVPTVLLWCPKLKRSIRFVVLHEHVGDISGELHQHIDLRFSPDFALQFLKEVMNGSDILACDPQKVTMKEMTCVRQFSVKHISNDQRHGFFLLQEMCQNRVNTCNICPHQGFDLSTISATKIRGKEVLICPCHGLTWSVETGRMVKRKPRKLIADDASP